MKNYSLLFIVIMLSGILYGQKDENHSKGTYYLGVGNISDIINQNVAVSPTISYEIKDNIIIGAGFNFGAYEENQSDSTSTLTTVGYSNVEFSRLTDKNDLFGASVSYSTVQDDITVAIHSGKMLFIGDYIYVEPRINLGYTSWLEAILFSTQIRAGLKF